MLKISDNIFKEQDIFIASVPLKLLNGELNGELNIAIIREQK